MRARNILDHKGHDVATIAPDATVRDAVAILGRHNFGALVVSPDEVHCVGIISERDVVRRLGTDGSSLLDRAVESVMSTEVTSAGLDEDVNDLMELMTEGRFRHVPVMEDGELVGIVSIGDVVKVRIDQLATEREQLASYITQG